MSRVPSLRSSYCKNCHQEGKIIVDSENSLNGSSIPGTKQFYCDLSSDEMTTKTNVFYCKRLQTLVDYYLTLFDPMVAAMARGANKSTRLRILNSLTSTWKGGRGIEVDNENKTKDCASWTPSSWKKIIIAMSWLNLLMWKGCRLLKLYRQAVLITRVPSIRWAGFVRIQEALPSVQRPGYQYKMYDDSEGMDLRYYYSHIKTFEVKLLGLYTNSRIVF